MSKPTPSFLVHLDNLLKEVRLSCPLKPIPYPTTIGSNSFRSSALSNLAIRANVSFPTFQRPKDGFIESQAHPYIFIHALITSYSDPKCTWKDVIEVMEDKGAHVDSGLAYATVLMSNKEIVYRNASHALSKEFISYPELALKYSLMLPAFFETLGEQYNEIETKLLSVFCKEHILKELK